MSVTIRPAAKADMHRVLELIEARASLERLPSPPIEIRRHDRFDAVPVGSESSGPETP